MYSRIPHGESHTNVNLDVAIEMLEHPGKVLYANFHPYPGESGVLHRNHQTDSAKKKSARTKNDVVRSRRAVRWTLRWFSTT